MTTNTAIKTMKVAQIVPRLPPYVDGVGDYAMKLAGQLLKAHHIETQFIVFKPGPKNNSEVDNFPVIKLSEHNTKALLDLMPKNVDGIVLHYSNYPYLESKWKAPFWLVDGLRAVQQQYSVKLIVMFHELPTLRWRQIKILNPIQSVVSRQLAQVADTVITDSSNFKKHLSKWARSTVPCIPDFSTIGESETVSPLQKRDCRLIVFGGHDRHRVYKHHLPALLKTCQALNIEEICDIGAALNLNTSMFGNVRLVEMGFQSADSVRHLMATSLAGLMDYTSCPGDLGKSSVFAAFCAHGLLPICTVYNPSEADGIYLNQHYLVAGESLNVWNLNQLQAIATQAHTWYSRHNLEKNTSIFASYLRRSA